MKVLYLRVSNFRGFEHLELKPQANVFLTGQPGAGRSDLIEALRRALSHDSTRFSLFDDLDFNCRDLSRRIEIEVVLGDLGTDLEQMFLDRLEFWDQDKKELIEEIDGADEDSYEAVLRFCYRAEWEETRQQARHWVDSPKFSNPETGDYKVIPHILREELPVALINTRGDFLSLGGRSDLRRIIDANEETDFASYVENLRSGVEELSARLVESEDLSSALERILSPLRLPLGLGDRTVTEIIRFATEGGTLAGILRGLQPTLKLREELGFLPLQRHGSTLSGLIQSGQALARRDAHRAVVLLDDFGEGVDIDASLHLASILRASAGQLWLSTRVGAIGQCFRPEEFVRLTVSAAGTRTAHSGYQPTTRRERIAARHFHLQILPAVSSEVVVIVEGPHDRAALTGAAFKLHTDESLPLLAAQRITVLDAGAAEGSGGNTAIPRLAGLARDLGFYVISLVDWDKDEGTAQQTLTENLASADVVIRWPRGYAVERALLEGLSDEVIRAALQDVSQALSIQLEFDPDEFGSSDLIKRSTKFIKSAGGLHNVFIDALPRNTHPPLIRDCLNEIRTALSKSGHIQL